MDMLVLFNLLSLFTWAGVVLMAGCAGGLFRLMHEKLEAIYGYDHLTHNLRKVLLEGIIRSQQRVTLLWLLSFICSLVLALICGVVGAGWYQLMALAGVIVAMVAGAISLQRSESARWRRTVQ